jgi:5'-nucleotidase
MKDRNPLILLTNDDGAEAEGLLALKREMSTLGMVVVVAPDEERSAVSQALTIRHPIRIHERSRNHYAVTGTPADCVLFALRKLLTRLPDLVVSGINHGPNLGDDIIYSGTVAGAREAALHQVPAIAFSLVTEQEAPNFVPAAQFACRLVQELDPISPGTFLNVNIPEGEFMDYRFTRQGSKVVAGSIEEKKDPRGRKYYWIGRDESEWLVESDTDYQALRRGFVSVTPLQRDQTDYRVLRSYVEDRQETLDSVRESD